MLWDLFCRVIDNHGDVGVCWRLAANLASRGEQVRLWIDDARALAWMAPEGAAGVQVLPWPSAGDVKLPTAGDVAIEAFGCDLPEVFVGLMAAREPPPVWINLEYLSAQAYVERSHGLPSPQSSGAARGLMKWFFYPGFTVATGGLLREAELAHQQAAFDRPGWLKAQGIDLRAGEQVVALFSYAGAPLPQLLSSLAHQPALLLSCPGPAQHELAGLPLPSTIRHHALPWLSQPDFDRLLWSADLNLVRGEDSFVRAMWAGRPFVWHIYPQDDGAHVEKLGAFLGAFDHIASDGHAGPARAWMRAWNGLGPWPKEPMDGPAWSAECERWRAHLLGQTDLCTQLIRFAIERR